MDPLFLFLTSQRCIIVVVYLFSVVLNRNFHSKFKLLIMKLTLIVFRCKKIMILHKLNQSHIT